MKKEMLSSLFLLTCLSCFSCGKKVKVELIGDSHLTFEKNIDTADTNKDYVTTAIPELGYWLYQENLEVFSNGIQLSDYQKSQYYLDEDNQKITVVKSAIMGDIKIVAKSIHKQVKFTIIVPSVYKGIESKTKEDTEYGVSFFNNTINRDSGEYKINVSPSDVVYEFAKNEDDSNYHLDIKGNQFYRDIVVELLE